MRVWVTRAAPGASATAEDVAAMRALVRHHDAEEGEGWAVRLAGIDEVLMVSRRQVAAVREALGE